MFMRNMLRSSLYASVSIVGLLATSQWLLANPTGGSVEAGSATIGQVDNRNLVVQQQSQRAIINWDSFSVGTGETVRFELPSAQSVTLNRDLGSSRSEILGNIESNGRFFLVNPNGILFGPNSRVDVAGLVATTHDIRSQDFMSGNYSFGIAGQPNASVITQGQVSVRDLGFAAFVAPHVRNDGAIVARLGRVELASASGFTLDMHGDRLISFLVENPNEHQMVDANGQAVSALVENSGAITADGGVVALSASAARGVIDRVINTDGIIQANTVERRGGRIILGGGGTGTVRAAGRVAAQGTQAGDSGGTIQVTGEVVVADAGSTLDASGMAGGGTILFGGDYLGGNTTNAEIFHLGIELEDHEIQTSRFAMVADGARMAVDALDTGDGGKLIVWSDEATLSYGHLSARGGQNGGDGGFIETSGQYLQVGGIADASAPRGSAGIWLLDPMNIAIDRLTNGRAEFVVGVDLPLIGGGSLFANAWVPTDNTSVIAASFLEASLNGGTNVAVLTFGTVGPGDGNIFLRTDIRKTSGGRARLFLGAEGSVFISAGVNVTSTSGALDFDMFGNNILAGGMGQLALNGGTLFLTPRFGATLSTSSPMPNRVAVYHRNDVMGSATGRIDLTFGQDRANYTFSRNVVEYRTGAVNLRDRRSTGFLDMDFARPVEVRLHNLSLVHDERHNFQISNTRSGGAVPGAALDGIPEVVGGAGLRVPILAEPTSAVIPVVEVSLTYNQGVDAYRITAPSGQRILDAHLASLRPRTPIEQVVQQAAPAVRPFIGPVQPQPMIGPIYPPTTVEDSEFMRRLDAFRTARNVQELASFSLDLARAIANFNTRYQLEALAAQSDNFALQISRAQASIDGANIGVGFFVDYFLEDQIQQFLERRGVPSNIAESASASLGAAIVATIMIAPSAGAVIPGLLLQQSIIIAEAAMETRASFIDFQAITFRLQLANAQNAATGVLSRDTALDILEQSRASVEGVRLSRLDQAKMQILHDLAEVRIRQSALGESLVLANSAIELARSAGQAGGVDLVAYANSVAQELGILNWPNPTVNPIQCVVGGCSPTELYR